ncbi:MAG TPA: enoyl-CoA hydratase/isomerase family protein [Dehalococcoidia bacterium]|nr:enoyl-CoA hydratase/isomerase family protein [Dehalococcoidia bacterium]
MKYRNVLLKIEGAVATITLNRPEKLNAINDAMFRELLAALDEVRQEGDSLVVVIKGAGRSFSAGQDLSGVGTDEVMPPNPRSKAYLYNMFATDMQNQWRWQTIFEFPKITVAQVHGYCLGGGLDLAMACRAIIATDNAVLGDPSVRMGLASPNPLWTYRIGLKKSKELLLTGKYIDGKEAERIGLVMKAVPADKLEEEMSSVTEGFTKSAGIGGFDQLADFWSFNMAALDLGGLAAARRLAGNAYVLSAIQRPERSITDRGEFNFYDVRDKKGLKAAIEERDAPFKEYFPPPQPKKR